MARLLIKPWPLVNRRFDGSEIAPETANPNAVRETERVARSPKSSQQVTEIVSRCIADGLCGLFHAGAAAQVGFDLKLRAAAEASAVDLQILHDPLHIVARLGEWNELNPVDRIDLGIARIAIALDPFLDAAAAGVVGGKGHDVGTAIVLEQSAEFGGAKGRVVDRIILQPGEI